jgi:hypothetical protein
MYSYQIKEKNRYRILEYIFYILVNKRYCLIRFSHVKIKNIIYFPYKKLGQNFLDLTRITHIMTVSYYQYHIIY